jgi:hypothetical protein
MADPTGPFSERDWLQYFLDQQRGAVLAILDGLDETQLHTPVLPSGWSPIGMLHHLSGAEAMWFQVAIRGEEPEAQWEDGIVDPPYDPHAPFLTAHRSHLVFEDYRRQGRVSNEILQDCALDSPLIDDVLPWTGVPKADIRWAVLHMIEETARHAGHLDAARELLDGTTGLGPR